MLFHMLLKLISFSPGTVCSCCFIFVWDYFITVIWLFPGTISLLLFYCLGLLHSFLALFHYFQFIVTSHFDHFSHIAAICLRLSAARMVTYIIQSCTVSPSLLLCQTLKQSYQDQLTVSLHIGLLNSYVNQDHTSQHLFQQIPAETYVTWLSESAICLFTCIC